MGRISIQGIRNTFARRCVLVILVAPLTVLSVIVNSAAEALATLRDLPYAFKSAWDGRK